MELCVEKDPALNIVDHGGYTTFALTPEARQKLKNLSDEEFEKEIESFDRDTQFFLRIARGK